MPAQVVTGLVQALSGALSAWARQPVPEGRNPAASFKDRASVVGVTRALARKARVIPA